MGASGWDYVVAYHEDVRDALLTLQQRVLDDREFLWELDVPRPTTLAKLAAHKHSEDFWAVGTHAVLDLDPDRIAAATDDETFNVLSPAPAVQVRDLFGVDHPARAYFERRRWQVPQPPRWSGYYLVLNAAGKPSRIAIWGLSGD